MAKMKKDPVKPFAGENTSKVRTAKFGRYATIMEPTKNFQKGDTIILSKKAKTSDGYLIGGDYKASKVGTKKHKMK